MATQTKTDPTTEAFEKEAEGVTEVTDQATAVGKKAGVAYLDGDEKVVRSTFDAYEKTATATNVEWISTAAAVQTNLARELTGAYVTTARELIA